MISKGRKAERELQRRRPRLDARARVLVVCEGRATEPGYFRDFSHDLRAVVNLVVDDRAGSPKTLVDRAVQEKRNAERQARRVGDRSARFDVIWCVFDVDEHPLIAEAQEQARAHSIRLAISNPCFELWLLFHYQDQTAFIDRHAAQSLCRHYMPGYGKRVRFDVLKEHYEAALQRALKNVNRNDADGEPDRNPVTRVHDLTEFIRQLGREAHLQRITTR